MVFHGMRTLIKHALVSAEAKENVCVSGWVRSRRDSKGFSFLEINDGSCLSNLQAVVDGNVPGYDKIVHLTTGASVIVEGRLVASPAAGQKWEIHATNLKIVGLADATYPLQKKGHSLEFLRTIAHLRPRSNLFGAIFRTRSRLAYAIHQFFQEREFVYVHTPIITASDCEGAGEMFRVTTLKDGSAPAPTADFFGKPTYLTVSGQLEAETFACALSNVYTFGPTFRAENSNTSRHAAEFWMIEPERPFQRVTYTDALEILTKSGRTFEHPVQYGLNFQSEHERFLTEEHFKCPVTVYNYPKEIKPFYMRLNDDGKTVAAMDVLVPGIGEVIGGSQREERLDVLEANMRLQKLQPETYWWYLDLRRYGTVPHAGFGLGFERLLMFLTGVSNIRDIIPFARTPGNVEF